MNMKTFALCAAMSLAVQGSALAHITLETGEAPAASTYKAVMRVGTAAKARPPSPCACGSPTASSP